MAEYKLAPCCQLNTLPFHKAKWRKMSLSMAVCKRQKELFIPVLAPLPAIEGLKRSSEEVQVLNMLFTFSQAKRIPCCCSLVHLDHWSGTLYITERNDCRLLSVI